VAHAQAVAEHKNEGLRTDTVPLLPLPEAEEPVISLAEGDVDSVVEAVPPALETALLLGTAENASHLWTLSVAHALAHSTSLA
jgi:hypothetical protein